MEADILAELNYDIISKTAIDFLPRLVRAAKATTPPSAHVELEYLCKVQNTNPLTVFLGSHEFKIKTAKFRTYLN